MNPTSPPSLIVLGGGPAGYAAAIRGAQLGENVVCVEAERVGGTCLNWGCIPSKALLKSAELYRKMQTASSFGLRVEQLGFDFPQVIERSRKVAAQMASGIELLFKKYAVRLVKGYGQVAGKSDEGYVVQLEDGTSLIGKRILLATGCVPKALPQVPFDGKVILNSKDLLGRKSLPKSCLILGAGAIGMEFAYFLNAFGCQVVVIETQDRVLPLEDRAISKEAQRQFKRQGITVLSGHTAMDIEKVKGGVQLEAIQGKGAKKLKAETLLVAIGVRASLEGLVDASLPLKTQAGYVQVDEQGETNLQNIYAVGDLTGPPALAHVATFKAVALVEGIFSGKNKTLKYFPSCTYCQPEVASVGLTEEALKANGQAYFVSTFPFSASGKSVASGNGKGFIKLLFGQAHRELLGAHLIGEGSTELIAELSLALQLEATAEDIHATIHAHPTLAEGIGEAAALACGSAIHL